MGPGDEANEGSPYLYDADGSVEHRGDGIENPNLADQYGRNPNQGIIDMPERIDDPTAIEWMD